MRGSQKSLYDYSTNSRGSDIPYCSECDTEFIISYVHNSDEKEPKYCPFCSGEIRG